MKPFLHYIRIRGMSIIEQMREPMQQYNEAWVKLQAAIDEAERIRKHNAIYWDRGLTNAGIDVTKPISSGELICCAE